MHLTFLMMWGKLAIIDLHDCDKDLIKNKSQIKKFVAKLCEKIEMKRQGETIIKRFGKDSLKGYSIMQFIETSAITIHFDETENRAFIDIFSCEKFNEKKAEKFSKEFFKAKRSKTRLLVRT